MARVTAQAVRARRDALQARGVRGVIILESTPESDAAVCFAIKDGTLMGPRWTEHSFASAGAAYDLDPENVQEAS